MKIYLGNLSYEVTEEDLRMALGQFGQVDSVKIITEPENPMSHPSVVALQFVNSGY